MLSFRLISALRFWAPIAAILIIPAVASAQFVGQPFATAGYEYDSNIASVATGDPANVLRGGLHRDDQVRRAAAGVTAKYQWSQQVLALRAEGRRYDFNHFARLNHNDYALGADLDWKFASAMTGKLDYSQEQRMADLKARLSSDLILELERRAGATVDFRLTPDWHLEVGARHRDLDSPQPGLPAYGLKEATGDAAIKYDAPGNWTLGIAGERINGRYRGAILVAPSYKQSSLSATIGYKAGTRTLFNSALGYTKRENSNAQGGNVSGTTGLVSYTRQLTGKTSVFASYERSVNSYVFSAASEVDTIATLKADWEATAKISVNVGYAWTKSAFTGETVPFSTTTRADRYQASSLNIVYTPVRWFSINPYASYQTRGSNVSFYKYNGAVVGILLKIQRN